MRSHVVLPAFLVLAAGAAAAQDAPPASAGSSAPEAHLARFAAGAGPSREGGVFHLLDAARSPGQSNAVAFDLAEPGLFARTTLSCRMRVEPGGDGGAFVLLDTAHHGARGPAPFVANWTEPNLRGAFAVGIDVHDPKDEQPFGPRGNYLGLPEREVSLHWDGREIAKRLARPEFRGDFAAVRIDVEHVAGGAEVTVRIADEPVFDRWFVAGYAPRETRLAAGASTREGAPTLFDVKDVRFERTGPVAAPRAPLRVRVFDHVLTDNAKTAYEREATLPPREWAFGRVTMTIEIHDAGDAWDEWDRNGEVSVWDQDGVKRGIVPFITSYRTPCRWDVDVTHFRPWLAGRTRLEIAAGTDFYKNRGYSMSVTLDFHHGRPELEPWRIVPLWNGTAQYKSDENAFADFFAPQTVAIDADARAARIVSTTTGHTQVGEFTPSKRAIVFTPDADATQTAEHRFEHTLWRTDCYLNPNRPQFGTWKYARAGWAPGDVVRPWWIDVTPHLAPGKNARVRYIPSPYSFEGEEEKPAAKDVAAAIHVVRSYLVLYRAAASSSLDAPRLEVLDVNAGSNAEKAGIRAGDWLVSYEDRALATTDDLRSAIAAAAAAGKKTVAVVLYRDAERVSVNADAGRLGIGLAER